MGWRSNPHTPTVPSLHHPTPTWGGQPHSTHTLSLLVSPQMVHVRVSACVSAHVCERVSEHVCERVLRVCRTCKRVCKRVCVRVRMHPHAPCCLSGWWEMGVYSAGSKSGPPHQPPRGVKAFLREPLPGRSTHSTTLRVRGYCI